MATFKEAFNTALNEKGTGATFTWNGKEYTTNLKSGKTQKAKVNPQVADMAGKGSDKSYAPKAKVTPKAKPSAPLVSPRPQRKAIKPTVDSTAPVSYAAPVNRQMSVAPKAKATGTATAKMGVGSASSTTAKPRSRNEVALRKGAANVASTAKEVMTKGYAEGSAYANRMAAKQRNMKATEKALFDARLAQAERESEISGASRSTKGKAKAKK